jgi:hypothetical protein
MNNDDVIKRLVDSICDGPRRRVEAIDATMRELNIAVGQAMARHPGSFCVARVVDVARGTVIVACPYCGERHEHGLPDNRIVFPEVRRAHCVYARPRRHADRPRRAREDLERVPNGESRSYVIVDVDGLTGRGGTSSPRSG